MQHLCVSHHPPPSVSPRADAGTQSARETEREQGAKNRLNTGLNRRGSVRERKREQCNEDAARDSLVMSVLPKTASPVCLLQCCTSVLNTKQLPVLAAQIWVLVVIAVGYQQVLVFSSLGFFYRFSTLLYKYLLRDDCVLCINRFNCVFKLPALIIVAKWLWGVWIINAGKSFCWNAPAIYPVSFLVSYSNKSLKRDQPFNSDLKNYTIRMLWYDIAVEVTIISAENEFRLKRNEKTFTQLLDFAEYSE